MNARLALAALVAVAVAVASGCGKKDPKHPQGGHGHDHGHEEGGKGVVSKFSGPDGADAGHLELKLHDDKGDLELWLARDEKFAVPFDLPLDTKVTITFLDKDGRTVELAVRNRDRNEDEDGKPTVREGKTNYFIFPGGSGQDASWLKGEGFVARVRVSFEAAGKAYKSSNFDLRPHTHGEHGHQH